MKKYLIFLAVAFVTGSWATNAWSECVPGAMVGGFGTCCANSGTCPQYGLEINGTIYGSNASEPCLCILDDGEATEKYVPVAPCRDNSDCRNDGYCNNGECKEAKACSNCTSSSWADHTTEGYQIRTLRTCDYSNGKCIEKIEYRCAKNYFGESFNGTSGCARCWKDDSTGVNAQTAGPGSREATDCYIPANQEISNSIGKYLYTADCYYTK